MTQRMFVCHAKSDIEAASEIVDALESALELPNGTVIASSLPGYAADIRGEGDLHATLTGATLILALFTERSTYDPEFVFELGAAWALGIDVLPLLLGATSESDVPWPLRDRPTVRAQQAAAWNDLMQQLSNRLQVSLKAKAPEPEPDPVTKPRALVVAQRAAAAAVEVDGPVTEPMTTLEPPEDEAALEAEAYADEAEAYADEAEADARPVSMIAPVNAPADDVKLPPTAAIPAEAFEPPSAVRTSLPSFRMSLEAGRALSDCVFNREEAIDFSQELEEPFGRFVDAMGGSWNELRKLNDFDVWLGVTENLLQNLPVEGKQIGAWYELGYELAILHNLAGQGLFDSEERRGEAERLWRRALERFLIRAENALIPYEDLARVLSLLENLVAPRAERDLSNIARSLDELRRQAAGADQQHTAA